MAGGCVADPAEGARGWDRAKLTTSGRQLAAYYVVFSEPPAASMVADAGAGPLALTQAAARIKRQAQALRTLQSQRRPLVEATGAKVVTQLVRLANAFQVLAPAHAVPRLRAIEGVLRVERVPTFQRQLLSAVPVTRAPELWTALPARHGQGVRIGIIDSGIDYLHADFGGSGDPNAHGADDSTIIEPGSFPTARVVGGHDFVGDDYNPESDETSTPKPDPDPIDCFKFNQGKTAGGHGTHVAGIAAGGGVTKDGKPFTGPYEQSLDPSAFEVGPGVAPKAELYALRVFGCSGSTQLLAAALERAADPNQDDDFSDRLDIVNASLGSSFGLQSETNAELVRNLTAVGTLFVASAGNEGATFYATGSPGNYPEALSVAASVDRDFLALTVDAPQGLAGQLASVQGSFTTSVLVSGQLVYAQPPKACSDLDNAAEIAGRVALIDRGTCSFISKFERAMAAGAIAVVVADHEFNSAPFLMGGGNPGDVAIPGVLIRRVDGEALEAALDEGVQITIEPGKRYTGPDAELIASYSSRGPSAVGNLLKPEITGPGTSILSAKVGTGFEAASKQGTSMSSPLLAGAAALVLQDDPSLTPQQLKARLMNSAVVLSDADEVAFPVSRQGAGRVDIVAAVSDPVVVYADADDGRVAVSFGSLVIDEVTTIERQVIVDNRGATARSYALSVSPLFALPGVSFEVEPTTVDVAAGEQATLTIRLTVDPQELESPDPDPQTPAFQYDLPRHYLSEAAGYLRLTATDDLPSLGLPIYGVVRAAGQRETGPVISCSDGSRLSVSVDGPSAHPSPVVSAFELVEIHEENPDAAGDLARADLRAYGVASNAATAASFDQLVLYFAISVAGEWTTPAQAPHSAVGVLLDVDADEESDFIVIAEPFNKKDNFADVLASSTYDLASGNRLPSRRYLNIAPANVHDTAPYNNSVVVLSVLAHELGLDDDTESLAYSVYADAPGGVKADISAWQTLSLRGLVVDAAQLAPEVGKPIYGAEDRLRIAVDLEQLAAREEPQLPKLLLFHHNNILGKRWEVVDLSIAQNEALEASVVLPEQVDPGTRFIAQVQVHNVAERAQHEIQLKANIEGASLDIVTSDGVHCQPGPDLDCVIDELAAAGELTIRMQLIADDTADAASPSLDVVLTTAAGCVFGTTNKTSWKPVVTPQRLTTGGGCACHIDARGSEHGVYSWLALLCGLAMRRRSRCRPAVSWSAVS
jgi:subtilisin family serine protease